MFNGITPFYNGVATTSLRFNDDDDATLTRTPAGASNQKTWTYSIWFKIANTSASQTLFSGGANNSGRVALYMSGGQLITDLGQTGTYDQSVALLRDPSAWYHLVWAFDTTQGTGANRSRIYINGAEITLTKTRTWAQNTDYAVNTAALHAIGGFSNSLAALSSDAYHAETNFVDGSQLTPSSFGETKNGVWIPIDTSGLTFGTNGFRLKFTSTTHDAPASEGSADTDNIGADSSGENNHWTASDSIDTEDCAMPDSPENNFCTLNPLESVKKFADANQGLMTQSEGNLKFSGGRNVYGNIGVNSGKWYWEIINTSSTVNSVSVSGVITQGTQAQAYAVYYNRNGNKGLGLLNSGATESSYGATYTDDDIIGVALNMDDNQVTFFKNNADQGTITDANIAGGDVIAWTQNGANSGTLVGVYNFGQDSSFAGNETAQGNTDGRGIGDFYYAPPSGFLALCTVNLPESTIGPNSGDNEQSDNYFNTVTYTGNDANNRGLTGVGFKPDFLWHKSRNATNWHFLFDSNRGVDKRLSSNSSNGEGDATGLDSFDDNGFTVDHEASNQDMNASAHTYVVWNWKANGGTTTTNDASSTSVGTIDSVFQANTTAGFSIVTFAADNTAGRVVAHGLGVAPKMIITKGTAQETGWYTYHFDIGANKWLRLNETNAEATSTGIWGNTHPTSSVFTIGNNVCGYNNGGANEVIAFCFAEVEGYSKFGSWTGTGAADGTFVFTGFRPAFVMVKRASAAGNWTIMDNTRRTFNFNNVLLYPNSNAVEAANDGYNGSDFVSNGFKIRGGADGVGTDVSGTGTYIYMAFAEEPFKYANAR